MGAFEGGGIYTFNPWNSFGQFFMWNWCAQRLASVGADGNVLYAFDGDAITLWDIARGAEFAKLAEGATAYHPTTRTLVRIDPGMITTIAYAGRESAESWSRGVVAELARRIRDEQAFADLTVLGDALEQAGCPDRAMIDHCHAGDDHRGSCWVIRRLLA